MINTMRLPTMATPMSASRTLLWWAHDMVEHVQPSDTSYQHHHSVVTWARQGGAQIYQCHTDCSGFLIALLRQAYGLTPDEFAQWLGKRRPLAATFYDAITIQRSFTEITRVTDAQPGDVITVKYPLGIGGDDTGHIMLIAALPTRRAPTKPTVHGTSQWDVPVIDCSESGHGLTDTRRQPDGTFCRGVGQGVLRLYASAPGAITGYTWSDFSDSTYYDQVRRPLAVGRLDPQFQL